MSQNLHAALKIFPFILPLFCNTRHIELRVGVPITWHFYFAFSLLGTPAVNTQLYRGRRWHNNCRCVYNL